MHFLQRHNQSLRQLAVNVLDGVLDCVFSPSAPHLTVSLVLCSSGNNRLEKRGLLGGSEENSVSSMRGQCGSMGFVSVLYKVVV